MKPLYTVYTLSHPMEPLVIRYVGVTTQALQKRLHDMYSACTKPHISAYNTPVGEWMRNVLEEGNKPYYTVHYEGEDKLESDQTYRDLVNENISTGQLLNSTTGRFAKVRQKCIDDIGPSGKTVHPFSDHAFASLRRKLYLVRKKNEQSES